MRCARVAWLVLACAGAAGCHSTGSAPVVDRPIREEPDYAGPQSRAPADPAPAPARKAGTAAPAQKAATAPSSAQSTAAAPSQAPSSAASPPAQPRELAQREPDWRPDSYVVKKGDTLYSIALDHGLAYRDLAAWNGVTDPNVIRVGQVLKLVPPSGWRDEEDGSAAVIARPVAPDTPIEGKPLEAPAPPPTKSGPKGIKVAFSEQALARLRGAPATQLDAPGGRPPSGAAQAGATAAAPGPASKPPPAAAKPATAPALKPQPLGKTNEVDGVAWAWPAHGKLLHVYNEGANPKGVAIGGSEGQAILASAPGRIVYAGSGLRGYGKLVIIKHNDSYLSVYAHNRTLLVREGDRVASGQKIAEMGSTDSERVALHFEIRKLGRPVDPLRYLPQEEEG
jgi:lipoprotein NlpD